MSQEEVLKVLEERNKWINTNEIMEKLKTKKRSQINRALSRMLKFNEVIKREMPNRNKLRPIVIQWRSA